MRGLCLLLCAAVLCGCAQLQAWFAPPPPCAEAQYRQFDFWLGDWDVRRAGDAQARAQNRITSIMQGCAIKEVYVSDSGYSGESLNWYDPELRQWRQTWVDKAGTVLQLAGGLDAQGAMVLSGRSRRDEQGQLIHDRITWQVLEDGRVLQLWQSQQAGSERWEEVFRGYYSRRPPAVAAPTPIGASGNE